MTYLQLFRTQNLLQQLGTLCCSGDFSELVKIDDPWVRVFTLPANKLLNIIDLCLLIFLVADKNNLKGHCNNELLHKKFSRFKLDVAFRLSHRTALIAMSPELSKIEDYFIQHRFSLAQRICLVKCPYLSHLVEQKLSGIDDLLSNETVTYWENVPINELEELFINSAKIIVPETLALQLEDYYYE